MLKMKEKDEKLKRRKGRASFAFFGKRNHEDKKKNSIVPLSLRKRKREKNERESSIMLLPLIP
jgi:hypothetical protein